MNGDIHQLAAAYALDAVDERERAEFEAHYHHTHEADEAA